MTTLTLRKSVAFEQTHLSYARIIKQTKSIGNQLDGYTSMFKLVSYRIARHQWDRLIMLQKQKNQLQEKITVRFQLFRLGLEDHRHDNLKIQEFWLDVANLTKKLERFRYTLFEAKQIINIL